MISFMIDVKAEKLKEINALISKLEVELYKAGAEEVTIFRQEEDGAMVPFEGGPNEL